MMHTLHNNSILAEASWLDWLLGLSKLHWSQHGAELGWRMPLALWAWVLIAAAAAGLAVWSYSRLIGSRPARFALASVRALLLLWIVALLAGPMLVLPQERVEPDWLVMLVDRSASMQIRDVHGALNSTTNPANFPGKTANISRDESLKEALQQQADLFGTTKLGKDRRILWLGFDRTVYPITAPGQGALETAQGDGTLLRSAIESALDRVANHPVSGIVLLTDGRSPQPTGSDLLHRLQRQAVSLFSVPLGSPTSPLDVSIGRLDFPDRAFINDAVPVNVWIDHNPPDEPFDPSRVRVRLVDVAMGEKLDEQRIKPSGAADEPVHLNARSTIAGPANWRVEVEYSPADSSEKQPLTELVTDNNARTLSIDFVDRPLRTLYVEGYPRWEYRYLKNLLVREKSVKTSILLISADQVFAQEGTEPITRLPQTLKEFEPFDVIILGDVPSSYMTSEQMQMIREHVSSRGAGLLWIAGPQQTPRSYETTPLADLLPMRRPGEVETFGSNMLPASLVPSVLSQQLGILRLDPAQDQSPVEAQQFLQQLPSLWWAQNIGALKPATEILATASPVSSAATSASKSFPLLVRQRYGSGQSVYVATDDTWRWRRGRGDIFFDRFWIQLVRMIGRSRLNTRDDRVSLDISRRQVEIEQPVMVRAHIRDEQILSRNLPKITVQVQRRGNDASALDRFDLAPTAQPASKSRDTGSAQDFQALWRPTLSGNLVLRITEPSLADLNVTQSIEIIQPDDELRQTATDHARLESLSRETGGKVVRLNHLDELLNVVPNRAKRTPSDEREPLWNSPLALALACFLLTIEWVGRKRLRLA